MKENLDQYLALIADHSIQPCFSILSRQGLVLDPADPRVPVSLIHMFRWDLLPEQNIPLSTGALEFALIPQFGSFSVEIEGTSIDLEREPGPFDLYPGGGSNASALYLPPKTTASLNGSGEIIAYACPANRAGLPRLIRPNDLVTQNAGAAFWRHDRTPLVLPGNVSQNLSVFELYLPAGHWCDLPPATHDESLTEVTDHGETVIESNHETVQYHRCRMAGPDIDPFVFATQTLILGGRIRKSFLVHDGDVAAIPGGAYPTAACPFSDHILTRAMAAPAGSPPEAVTRELEIYDFLRLMEPFIRGVEDPSMKPQVSRANLRAFCKLHDFGDLEASVLVGTLLEQGFEIVGG
jgi:5-deoxy-D-glucuronate isomerase